MLTVEQVYSISWWISRVVIIFLFCVLFWDLLQCRESSENEFQMGVGKFSYFFFSFLFENNPNNTQPPQRSSSKQLHNWLVGSWLWLTLGNYLKISNMKFCVMMRFTDLLWNSLDSLCQVEVNNYEYLNYKWAPLVTCVLQQQLDDLFSYNTIHVNVAMNKVKNLKYKNIQFLFQSHQAWN